MEADSFKEAQKKHTRVRQAYNEKEFDVIHLLTENSIESNQLRIYLRAFKQEELIELWAKNKNDNRFKLIKKYAICRTSGNIGPKRKQGDLQIPEGFYHIDRFNPYSNFHLSLGINYPNQSDRILGNKSNLGGDIFIHGNCVTLGCLPITDDKIKELYIFCVEAKSNGQNRIPVSIFPSQLSETKFKELKEEYISDIDKIGLWADLKKGYDLFNETKQLPNIKFLPSGRHKVYE